MPLADAGAVFVVASASFFTINPLLHFVWVVGALFLVFFALSTVNNYLGVLMFSVMIGVGLPIWDRSCAGRSERGRHAVAIVGRQSSERGSRSWWKLLSRASRRVIPSSFP